jgi:hypothetical protein
MQHILHVSNSSISFSLAAMFEIFELLKQESLWFTPYRTYEKKIENKMIVDDLPSIGFMRKPCFDWLTRTTCFASTKHNRCWLLTSPDDHVATNYNGKTNYVILYIYDTAYVKESQFFKKKLIRLISVFQTISEFSEENNNQTMTLKHLS